MFRVQSVEFTVFQRPAGVLRGPYQGPSVLASEREIFPVIAIGSPVTIRHAARVLAGAICVCGIHAQDVPTATQRVFDTTSRMEIARMEDAKRRAAAEDLRRFHEKMMDFVRAWNDFTNEYVQRGTFNVKKARLVSQAWQKLEREHSWPLPK